jgi:hypothetical protein
VEPDLVAVQAAVMRWLQEEAGFAQVISINRDGFPVGRTMGAPVEDDWSVTLIQRNTHRRIGQLRRNPKVEIIWQGTPAPGSTNDRPHVYDFDLLAPRVVFLRGVAEFLDEAETLRRFRVQTERLRSRGFIKAPLRDDADVAANLIGVHVRPLQVRCEGFGDGPQSFTWALD